MKAWALLLLVPALASGQFLPTGGGSSGTVALDPTRNDTAASYTATGANGVRTAAQASPGALGMCSALAGAYSAATPTNETGIRPYFCDGVAWRRVFTSADGVLPNADVYVPGYSFNAQAPAGDYAFRANNRARWDFGDGVNDECVSIGARVVCGSFVFGDVRTDTIANNTTNQHVLVDPTQYLRISPRGGTGCSSGTAGGLQTNSADGNRPWWCDGTNRFRISRVLTVPITFDFPSVPNGSCTTASITVTGAALNDTISVNADFTLPASVGIGNVRSTATDTVSLRLCNHDPTNAADPDSGIYRFRIER